MLDEKEQDKEARERKEKDEENRDEYGWIMTAKYGPFTFKLDDIPAYRSILQQLEKENKPDDDNELSKLILNQNLKLGQDLRLYEYAPVIFECPDFDDKNLYNRKVENIILPKKAFASQVKDCFIDPKMSPDKLKLLIEDLAKLKIKKSFARTVNRKKPSQSTVTPDVVPFGSVRIPQYDAVSIDRELSVSGLVFDEEDVTNNEDFKRLVHKHQPSVKKKLFDEESGHIGSLHRFNNYFVYNSKFYDSKTDNYVLHTIFEDLIPRHKLLQIEVKEAKQRAIKTLQNVFKVNLANTGDFGSHSGNNSRKNLQKQVKKRLLSSPAGNDVEMQFGVGIGVGFGSPGMLYKSQFTKDRYDYVLDVIFKAVQGINGLLNGEGGNLWFGIDDKTFKVKGLHLTPSEMYFIEDRIKKAVGLFEIDNYQQLRQEQRQKNMEQGYQTYDKNLSRKAWDSTPVLDKFVGLMPQDFRGDGTLSGVEKNKNNDNIGIGMNMEAGYQTKNRGSIRHDSFNRIPRASSTSVVHSLKVSPSFYPVIDKNGVILTDWYVLHCEVQVQRRKLGETQYINSLDDLIYVKYMTQLMNKLPNCRLYEKNYDKIYDRTTGKPWVIKSRLRDITLST